MTQNVRNGAGAGSSDFMLLPGGKGKTADSSGRDFESFLSPGISSITRRTDVASRRTDLSGIGSQPAKNRVESRNTERTGQEKTAQDGAKKTESRADSITGQKGETNTVQEPGQKAEELEKNSGLSESMEGMEEEPSVEAMEALVTSVIEFLNGIAEEVVFVDPEAIQGWMQEHGMSLSDMLNPENLKQMVLDLNGLSDAAGFLTNGDALAEWNEIQSRLAELLGANETAVEDLQQMELSGRFGQMEAPVETEPGELVGEEPEFVLYEESSVDSMEETGSGEQKMADTQTGERSGVQSGERQSARTGEPGQENLANVFLNQMHEALGNAIEALDTQVRVSQTEILDQVMNQIRVGISQEVTSMDFMLHPESLGRVHVSVLAKEGMMTAQITVQNQEAKQALESQLVTLRQTFEDQGLKVESVEVNVSEFAFGEESQGSGQAKDERNGSGRRNRRFDYGVALDPTEGTEAIDESEEELSPLQAQEMEMAGAQVDYSA